MKAIWDISNKCSLNCVYCGASSIIDKEKSLTTNEIIKVVNNMCGMVSSVELYGGEPFLILNKVKDFEAFKNNDISITITTNGQFENSVLDVLVQSQVKVDALIISVDGIEKYNDSQRGEGTYSKSVRFVKNAINYKKKGLISGNVCINTVVTAWNVDKIITALKYWFDLGISKVVLSPVLHIGNANNHKEIFLSNEQILNFYESITSYVIKNNCFDKVSYEITNPLLAEYLNAVYGTKYSINKKECQAVNNVIYINSHADVKPCRSYNASIGNLLNDSLESLVPKFSGFMKLRAEYIYKAGCDCIYNNNCSICCLDKKKEEKQSICKIIESRYMNYIANQDLGFTLEKRIVMFKDAEKNNIYYFDTGEEVDYEDEGFNILAYLSDGYKTSKELSRLTSIDEILIFRFLIQEYTNNHVSIMKG